MAKILYINSLCNQKCVFCLGAKRKIRVFNDSQLPRLNSYERLVISGGETTLSPGIFKLLNLAKEKNIRNIELQTNAMTLENFNFCRRLVSRGIIREFNVNMPAHQESINDSITLTPGSFERRLTGISNLMRLRARVRLTFVINQLNYTTMPDYCRFIKKNFPQVKLLVFNFVQVEGAVRENTYLVPRFLEVKPYLLKALRYAKRARLDLATDNIPLCIFGERRYFCFSVDYNRAMLARKHPETDPTLNCKKSFIAACNQCLHKDKCGGIRRDYLELYGESEFNPFLRA